MDKSDSKINRSSIGGYFSLELPLLTEYHHDAIRLNSGRNCLEYILLSRKYKNVYIPYYICDTILKPFDKLEINYIFYHINFDFEIIEDITLKENEALLYTNYFGLKQQYITLLSQRYGERLIIDNTQAFFDQNIKGIDTFYTCRKFFGVSDGAYLYSSKFINIELEQDSSYHQMTHLLKSIDISQENAFNDFHNAENYIGNQDIKLMSKITQRIMQSIDYTKVGKIRQHNFLTLHNELKERNMLNINVEKDTTPLIYPYYSEDVQLREHLIRNRIYVAQYWPNVLEWTEKNSIEYSLAKKMIPLPIDQRYSEEDMNFILKTINR